MLRRVLPPLVLLIAAACERVEPPPPAPAAEFIVAAADSVFWIRSDADGIRVRGAPMVLAQVGGRFAELYITEDDHSFYDAVYIGQRLYKRDLVNGDSMPLVSDTLMQLLARAYAAANPDEQPLAPSEQGSENPRTIGSAEIRVLDVMGPWVSYEYRTDVDVIGRPSSHGIRRGVVDLRTGVPSTLDALFGRTAARTIAADGEGQWRAIRDSVLVASGDDETLRAQYDRLAFDARSFTLVVHDRAPRVRFTVAQSGAPQPAPALQLFPVAVEEPAWWEGVRGDYPERGEGQEQHWMHSDYTLVARPAEGDRPRVAFALRDAGGQEWRLGFVPAPVLRVMWLDDAVVAPGTRDALVNSFNDAALYAEDTRIVQRTPRAVAQSSRFHFAGYSPRPKQTPRRHLPVRPRS
jgi:hypothetical protein